MIDRLMISCSVIELTFVGCLEGLAHMSIFQWVMLLLLIVKMVFFILLSQRRSALGTSGGIASVDIVNRDEQEESDEPQPEPAE